MFRREGSMGVRVKPRKGESIERTLRRLKKIIEKEKLRRDMMRHRHHETDRERRRHTRSKNARRGRKRAAAR